MRYLGGKGRYTAGVISVIRQLLSRNQSYWEPFCGSCKVLANVRCRKRLGSDVDKHIIRLLRAVRDGWIPPSQVTEEEYVYWRSVRDTSNDPMVGFVGYGCSFAGKFFGGYARSIRSTGGFASEARRQLLKVKPKLQGVKLLCLDYQSPIKADLIYCDPPYSNTTKVGRRKGEFDHEEFWNWVKWRSKESVVLISEYSCPIPGAVTIWQETKGKCLIGKVEGPKEDKTEKLFCLNPKILSRIGLGLF